MYQKTLLFMISSGRLFLCGSFIFSSFLFPCWHLSTFTFHFFFKLEYYHSSPPKQEFNETMLTLTDCYVNLILLLCPQLGHFSTKLWILYCGGQTFSWMLCWHELDANVLLTLVELNSYMLEPEITSVHLVRWSSRSDWRLLKYSKENWSRKYLFPVSCTAKHFNRFTGL